MAGGSDDCRQTDRHQRRQLLGHLNAQQRLECLASHERAAEPARSVTQFSGCQQQVFHGRANRLDVRVAAHRVDVGPARQRVRQRAFDDRRVGLPRHCDNQRCLRLAHVGVRHGVRAELAHAITLQESQATLATNLGSAYSVGRAAGLVMAEQGGSVVLQANLDVDTLRPASQQRLRIEVHLPQQREKRRMRTQGIVVGLDFERGDEVRIAFVDAD